MSVKLNHTIVSSRDKRLSADFLAEVLGLRRSRERAARRAMVHRAGSRPCGERKRLRKPGCLGTGEVTQAKADPLIVSHR